MGKEGRGAQPKAGIEQWLWLAIMVLWAKETAGCVDGSGQRLEIFKVDPSS